MILSQCMIVRWASSVQMRRCSQIISNPIKVILVICKIWDLGIFASKIAEYYPGTSHRWTLHNHTPLICSQAFHRLQTVREKGESRHDRAMKVYLHKLEPLAVGFVG